MFTPISFVFSSPNKPNQNLTESKMDMNYVRINILLLLPNKMVEGLDFKARLHSFHRLISKETVIIAPVCSQMHRIAQAKLKSLSLSCNSIYFDKSKMEHL